MKDIDTSEDTPSSTCWVMNQEDGINFLQGHYEGSDLTGALIIREEYSEAFRAVILEFAATGDFNDPTEAASDEESGQNEILVGAQDSESYLNPFIDLATYTFQARRVHPHRSPWHW